MRKAIAYFRRIRLDICNAFVKFCVLSYCRLQGVYIGKNCKFIGFPCFAPSKNGDIIVGSCCIFRSRTTSNMIGLNHKCIISTSDSAKFMPKITIGDNCGFSGVSIRCFKSISIGNNVRVGANCLIIDGDGHFSDERTSPPENIVIEDNVFIGTDCIIRKGVTIGRNSVIGMRSMVLHDIPAYSVAVGSPAKVIK